MIPATTANNGLERNHWSTAIVVKICRSNGGIQLTCLDCPSDRAISGDTSRTADAEAPTKHNPLKRFRFESASGITLAPTTTMTACTSSSTALSRNSATETAANTPYRIHHARFDVRSEHTSASIVTVDNAHTIAYERASVAAQVTRGSTMKVTPTITPSLVPPNIPASATNAAVAIPT